MSITYHEDNNIGFIEFDQKDSKVNLLTAAVLRELDAILDSLAAKSSLKAVVVLSKKKDIFIAGADIKEIEGITDSLDGREKSKSGQDVLNKLEDLPVPTVAFIDGVALGGGCELALACRYRVATFNDKIKIGLPEVNLGILPGFGGTYRLPRIVGLSEGLKMILSGKPVDAVKALRIGLVDQLVPQKGWDQHLKEFISRIPPGGKAGSKYARKKKKGMQAFLDDSRPGNYLVFEGARKDVLKQTKGFYPAPLKAVDVIKKSFYTAQRVQALALEAEAFGELVVTETSKNLIHVFYLSEKYRKLSVPGAENVRPRPVLKCGVVGAGVMGGGIAQLLSYKDIWVRLKDINYDALALGLKSASKIYRQALEKRQLKKHEAQLKMARITPTLDYRGFGTADAVIEAVVENMEVKKKVIRELSAAVGENTVLATNTSALSVTEMARQAQDPSRVIGLHFFNPAHRMPLVEIVTTPMTSLQTLVTTLDLAKRLGKTPVIVKDSCGFLVNRILLGYINEAGRLLEEGWDVVSLDKVMTDFGMPMGPFTLCDEVGLDVGIKVLHILQEGLGDRFQPVEIFENIYKEGFLGKKSGKGFYLYGAQKTINPRIQNLHKKKAGGRCGADTALERMVYLMINEAAGCLQEGIVEDPGAVDTGMIFGTGFPAFRGGLLRYADTVGMDTVVSTLERFEHELGAQRFHPVEYLLKIRAQGKKFYAS